MKRIRQKNLRKSNLYEFRVDSAFTRRIETCFQGRGRGAKIPELHIRAKFRSFQVGLEWYPKPIWNPHNEAPCRKKICKNFENLPCNRNFYSPYKNSETCQQKYIFFFNRSKFWLVPLYGFCLEAQNHNETMMKISYKSGEESHDLWKVLKCKFRYQFILYPKFVTFDK